MTNFNGFHSAAKLLDDINLSRIGHRIRVGKDEIQPVSTDLVYIVVFAADFCNMKRAARDADTLERLALD